MSSSEFQGVCLDQPDIPFNYYYFPIWGDKAIKIYHDPFELIAEIITKEEMTTDIAAYDRAITGEGYNSADEESK